MNKVIKNSSEEEENEISDEFRVSAKPVTNNCYRIEINGPIKSFSQFSTAVNILESAEEGDSVEIHLQSPGGCLDSTDGFVHAMRKCKAPIHIVATGGCHSAASIILLEADSFELSEGFNSLLHSGQNGAYGTVAEYYTKSDFDKRFRVEQFRSIYEGFLTEEEFESMIKGQDIWLDREEWIDRFKKRSEYFQKILEKISSEELS